ncbi:MAG: hypothetical protein ABJB01_00935 [Rudaea sp.]
MLKNRFYLLVASCALVAAGAASAAGFSSLEERMSQSEFHAAGLDKLSPDELKNLDDWLRAHAEATTTYVTPSGAPVFYPKEAAREPVESRIDGKFSGWYGHNVFKLENGQEWTQAESGSSAFNTMDHPEVRIKPMLVGAWLMYVKPCGCSVRVERTK